MANNNSTFVPGMQFNSEVPNPYATPNGNVQGTYVPNMQAASPSTSANSQVSSKDPIVGFLYTISHMGITEYWPIHLGANIIGRDENCDICLKEATISSRHAQINVKQMRTSKKLAANIQDIGSKCGMFLNDEELDYETHPCKNGDIVTIGENYKLLLILVDTDACGLSISENFKPVEETKMPENHTKQFDGAPINPYDRNDGTIDLSGAAQFSAPGGTMILE